MRIYKQNRLKILHLTPAFNRGGINSHLESLATYLIKRGHQLFICSHRTGPTKKRFQEIGVKLFFRPAFGSVKYFHQLFSLRKLFITRQLHKILVENKINLIHIHSHKNNIINLYKQLSIPQIFTVHSTIPPVEHPFLTKRTAKRITHFIAISTQCKKFCQSYYKINPSKISIIPNSIDTKKFKPVMHKNKKFKLTIVSRIDAVKKTTLDNTIRSLPFLESIKIPYELTIIGTGNFAKNFIQNVKKITKRLRFGKIILRGELDQEALSKILPLSDVFIGVGRSAMEAMSCGIPTIIVGSHSGEKGGNYGGIVNYENIDELVSYHFSGRNSKIVATPELIAKDIITLMKSKKLREKIGKESRKIILDKFDNRKILFQIEKLYYNLFLNTQ